MTATTTAPVSRILGVHVSAAGLLRSEWTKFRSLRSSSIILFVSVALTIGLGALISGVTASHWADAKPARRAGFDAVTTSLDGVRMAELAIGVLGVLLISSEYTTGMIRASLTAVPRRVPVLWAKMGVFSVITAVTALVSTFVAFYLGQSLLSSAHINVAIGAPGALRQVIGAALFLVVTGIIGMALGAILRNTAAGISTLVAVFFVLPPLMQLLPTNWADNITPYLPANAGEALWAHGDTTQLSPWTGFGVMCLWALAAVIGAVFVLRSRDA
ncbi:MAG: hypothetical protein ABI251_09545 [Mycobacteriaceae bacterium]